MRLPAILRTAPWVVAALLTPAAVLSAGPEKLELRRQTLDLPGAPAAMITTDLDGDEDLDLLVVVAYTEWGQTGEDRIEDAVQISTVIPTLFDRREVHAFLADGSGGLQPLGEPLELPLSVLSLEKGPGAIPAIALTDDGVSRLSLVSAPDGPALRLEPWIDRRPAAAGANTFFSGLQMVHDLDGDGIDDLLLPADRGLRLYRGTAGGTFTGGSEPWVLPGAEMDSTHGVTRVYPLPRVGDLDGDDRPDLLVVDGFELHTMRGLGDGRFAEPATTSLRCLAPAEAKARGAARPDGDGDGDGDEEDRLPAGLLSYVGDIDGDGRAELVTELQAGQQGGWRKQLRAAKTPTYTLSFHRLAPDGTFQNEPYRRFEVRGYPIPGDFLDPFGPKFTDLDHDGRRDLVTVTLDFSAFGAAVRALTTRRISIGLDFHVYAQREDGSFREVPGLDLSEKLKLNLNDLRLSRIAQFAGDFDGDQRIDFLHLGRGDKATLHRGAAGCRYPARADLQIQLGGEIEDLGLVRVRDFDGDSRADLAITRTLRSEENEETAPVRLDLYLSGASR